MQQHVVLYDVKMDSFLCITEDNQYIWGNEDIEWVVFNHVHSVYFDASEYLDFSINDVILFFVTLTDENEEGMIIDCSNSIPLSEVLDDHRY